MLCHSLDLFWCWDLGVVTSNCCCDQHYCFMFSYHMAVRASSTVGFDILHGKSQLTIVSRMCRSSMVTNATIGTSCIRLRLLSGSGVSSVMHMPCKPEHCPAHFRLFQRIPEIGNLMHQRTTLQFKRDPKRCLAILPNPRLRYSQVVGNELREEGKLYYPWHECSSLRYNY